MINECGSIYHYGIAATAAFLGRMLKLTNGYAPLQAILNEHIHLFTLGENIRTLRSLLPTGGYTWGPPRQPVVVACWANAGLPRTACTTVGKWDAQEERAWVKTSTNQFCRLAVLGRKRRFLLWEPVTLLLY